MKKLNIFCSKHQPPFEKGDPSLFCDDCKKQIALYNEWYTVNMSSFAKPIIEKVKNRTRTLGSLTKIYSNQTTFTKSGA